MLDVARAPCFPTASPLRSGRSAGPRTAPPSSTTPARSTTPGASRSSWTARPGSTGSAPTSRGTRTCSAMKPARSWASAPRSCPARASTNRTPIISSAMWARSRTRMRSTTRRDSAGSPEIPWRRALRPLRQHGAGPGHPWRPGLCGHPRGRAERQAGPHQPGQTRLEARGNRGARGSGPILALTRSRDFLFIIRIRRHHRPAHQDQPATGRWPKSACRPPAPSTFPARTARATGVWSPSVPGPGRPPCTDFDGARETFSLSSFNTSAVYPGFEDLVSEEVEVPGHDGTLVPLSIIHQQATCRWTAAAAASSRATAPMDPAPALLQRDEFHRPARRGDRLRAPPGRRRKGRGLVPGRLQGDQAKHMEGFHFLRGIPGAQGLHQPASGSAASAAAPAAS